MADFEADDNQPSTSAMADIAEKRRKAAERQRRYRDKLKNRQIKRIYPRILMNRAYAADEQRRKNTERQRRYREKKRRMEAAADGSVDDEFVENFNNSVKQFCFLCNRLYFENGLHESSSSNFNDSVQENSNSKICSTCYSLLNKSKIPDQGTPLEFDPSIPEEERRFYMKAYGTIDQVRDKKVHCTTCKIHIGTAPTQEEFIRMHPVLRVTHCIKCHDFYNSGEFSKGEDGSELYCRWCGQGGEVYCCSSCPYVFCKSCIVKNLTRGVVADIEQNENWSCFSCAPKILWPLRAQHWALVSYIQKQKRDILARNLPDAEEKTLLGTDRSNCCRQSKTKCGNMSDSVESIDSIHSRSSMGSSNPLKKPFRPTSSGFTSLAKRPKTSNDEVVCTPDVLSMLEPDCQITVSPKPRPLVSPITSTPKVLSVQTGYNNSTVQQNKSTTAPPPLVLRNTEIQMRALGTSPIMRRTIVGQRAPSPGNVNTSPVYHTINGYRIDLNSAALQDTFRLPNGKLIQVKRQGTATNASPTTNNNWQQRATTPLNFNSRPVQITPAQPQAHYANVTQQHAVTSATTNQQPQIMRFNNFVTNNNSTPVTQNGTHIQMINGVPSAPIQVQQSPVTVRPVILKHIFPNTPIGQARTQLQEEVFSAMDICQHLTGKIQTLTNSNAYKQARNYLEVKELYIHLSYLLTYAVGRFKSLQDKCITDMRQLGFGADADSLENGQLAADKQASDDEDNEIEIIEPKTDTINLDSDNEDDETVKTPAPPKSILIADTTTTTILKKKIILPTNTKMQIIQQNPIQQQIQIPQNAIHVNPIPKNTLVGTPVQLNILQQNPAQEIPIQSLLQPQSLQPPEEIDFVTAAQSFLASMLDVDDREQNLAPSSVAQQRKQPRKKMTSKPNPTLIKQKLMLERERLEEMKRSDMKLKMKCKVALEKAEKEYPFIMDMLNKINSETRSDHETRDSDSSIELIEPQLVNDSSVEVVEAKRDNESSVEIIESCGEDKVVNIDMSVDVEIEPTATESTKSDTQIQKAFDKNVSQEDELVITSSKIETENSITEQSESKNDDITDVQKHKVQETEQNHIETEENTILNECNEHTSEIEGTKPMEVDDDDLVEYIEDDILKQDTGVNDNKVSESSVVQKESEKNDPEDNISSVSDPIKKVETTDSIIKITSVSDLNQVTEVSDKTDTERKSSPASNPTEEVEIYEKINSEDKILSPSNAVKEMEICEETNSDSKISSISAPTDQVESNSEDKISSVSDPTEDGETYESINSESNISSGSNTNKVMKENDIEDKITSVSDSIKETKMCEKTNSEGIIPPETNSIKNVNIYEKSESDDKITSVSETIKEVNINEKTDLENTMSSASNPMSINAKSGSDEISSMSDPNMETRICKENNTEDNISSVSDSIQEIEDEGTLMEVDETIMEDVTGDVKKLKKIEELIQKDSIEGSQTDSQTDDGSSTKDVEVTSTTVENETFLNSPDLFNDLIEVDPESLT